MTDSNKRMYLIVVDYVDKDTKVQHHISERNLSSEDAYSISRRYEKSEDFMVRGVVIRSSDIIREFHVRDANGNDVTRKFVKSAPKKEGISKKNHKEPKQLLSRNVFIVHGRDHEPMKELKTMLREFGLNPIVLHEQPSGSRTIVEKLEKHSGVEYAFVIVTPDDIGLSAILPILPPFPPRLPFEKRVRQNVILEFGYFMGLLGRDRVCCLYKGSVELPSDMHGIVYIPFKESVNEVRDKIVKELKAAGYEIKI